MKILMTGMTTRTVGSKRLKLNYINLTPCLKATLELLGHEVDQRRVTPEEDFGGYDLAFVHVCPGDKIVCQNVLEVCTVLKKMQGRAVIYVEDWIAVELRNSWNHILSVRWEKWKTWKGYTSWTTDQSAFVFNTVSRILYGDDWPVVANFFAWGDPTRFFDQNFATPRRAILDTSSVMVIPEFVRGPRERRWILGTLQKHDTWTKRQGFTWAIEQYGNERQGFPAIPEDQLVQLYANSWGVLAPGYPKAIHGWARARFALAAATGSVLFCDPTEGKLLGPSYTASRSQIELTSDSQLEMLALNQAAEFRNRTWGKERLLDELSGLIRGVVA
jgi:hypothetical protein